MSSRIPAKLRKAVIAAANRQCAYCRSQESAMGVTFEIDHIIPLAEGGKTSLANLCLCCPSCNRHKAARLGAIDPSTNRKTSLFHPLRERWSDHFAWDSSGLRMIGLTSVGRATVKALNVNRPQMLTLRKYWLATGTHPLRLQDK